MDKHHGPYTKNIEVKGVNHLEMNSHPDMRFKLNEILNGKIYNEVFNPKNKELSPFKYCDNYCFCFLL